MINDQPLPQTGGIKNSEFIYQHQLILLKKEKKNEEADTSLCIMVIIKRARCEMHKVINYASVK